MQILLFLFTIAGFAVVNKWLAWLDARKIGNKKTIKHGINGAVYVALCGVCFWLYPLWANLYQFINMILILFLVRQLVFDTFLNHYRNLDFFYVSKVPKSIIDRIENKIFGLNGALQFVVYIILWLILFIVQLFLILSETRF